MGYVSTARQMMWWDVIGCDGMRRRDIAEGQQGFMPDGHLIKEEQIAKM